ncbi:hypothetical protein GCM10009779_49540 [Polymorphospora rubra]|uniref:Uncharacterized protein n=1 Tax=Polymorphospora rubra TaxID=338584 RepID=A0A810N985_9ACTN|nr:hypothetical protein Prubr_53890 [Polymorphospora rubra]
MGDESAGTVDLNLAEVDAGHPVTGVGERPGDGDSAAAAEVQDGGAGREVSLQAGEIHPMVPRRPVGPRSGSGVGQVAHQFSYRLDVRS